MKGEVAMKENYEKPMATIVSFQSKEDLTIDGVIGAGSAPPGFPGTGTGTLSLDDKSSYQLFR